ncbi:outer membrane receptor protein involved in Fe transport [Hymenobacter luteus]|uniref:Outer membrane receptor protein involved in Fe transport n=2 Tax=Hymenobacter TaxID=89966 RepID=A0A7W9T288_9BACT|nr:MULTISPECIES: outer membrane beta-barrel family protein [Hymenobacter]MBB4602213.1 outer membrane receptor protein involved in Fe transport [Hymenobacter latericoloratus]MBB6059358.1 outer membrane receptor protein involved in Fe transport [Hymenobacter luteus]
MKKLFFLILITGSGHTVLAQMPGGGERPAGAGRPAGAAAQPQPGSGRITGTVTDAATKQPVPYATVALVNPATGKPVDGTAADDNGKFTIPRIAAGTYTVQISFIGYKLVEKTGVVITAAGNTVALGSVALESSAQALGEVRVEGQRSLVEEKVDRTVYNAEKDETTRGGDATDVLKRVPNLSVDLDGNVSLRGSQNIRVLINNRPSTISANSIADALKQIPADQIKTVEVITSPSAKYDAEGSGGIINIVTKQNNLQGFTLDLRSSAGLRGSDLGLNASYRVGKMGFSLSGGGRGQYNVPGSFRNEQTTYGIQGNDIAGRQLLSRTVQAADTRQQNVFGRYSLGWDYDINKYNFLSASVQLGLRNGTSYQDDLATNTTFYIYPVVPFYPVTPVTSSTESSSSLRDVKVLDNSNTLDATLNYTRTFETPQRELSLLAQYSRNTRTNNFTNTTQEGQGAGDYRRNLNDSYNEEVTLQLDYQTPLSKTQLVEFGAKDIMRRVNSDYTTFLNGQRQTGTTLSNVFDYNQNVAAAYASYTLGFLKNYTLKAGARYEYTTITADFRTDNAPSIPSYGVLVPSVNVSRKLANGNVLKAAYNRRIQRPSLQFLNPNEQSGNPLLYTVGNPELEPEKTNNFELGYNTFIKQTSLSFSVFARNTDGSIQPVRTQDGARIRTSYANIGTENAYGGSLNANVNIQNKLTLGGGADVYYATLDNNVSDVLYAASNQGWVVSGRLMGGYTFTKGWGIQAFSFYRGRQVQLQGYQGGFGVYSVGLKKDFADKKGSIGFGADNFFTPTNKIRSSISSPTLDQYSVNVLRRSGFRVNFSYRIGKMSMAQPKRRRSISNDDLKDGGSSDGGNGAGATPAQGPSGGRP